MAQPTFRVWGFIAAVYLAVLALYLAVILPHALTPHASLFPWPILAVGFAITEFKVVDVHFRGERHSFSLSEIPTVIGLFVLGPVDLLVALVVGCGVALLIESRQSRMRRAFNLGNVLLGGIVSLAVFHAMVYSHASVGQQVPTPGDWAATILATVSASVVGTILVATVITLSGGAPQLQRLASMLQFGLMVALANTSVALLAVVVLASDPKALVLLSIPTVTVYFAYLAYVSEREKHERLELIYESSRILQHSPELDASLFALVEHSRTMFRAEISRIVIFPNRAAGQALSTTSIQDGDSEVMVPTRARSGGEPDIWQRVRTEGRAFLWTPAAGETIQGRLLGSVMVSPLTGESGAMGMMLIANPLARGTEFDLDDLRLLETVANQVGVALENGQLERSLGELSRLKEELRHQAFHDALTNLPNRSLFREQVELRLKSRSPEDEPVVLFIDLDDFKVVNDTLGHAVGDRLLISVAQRIRGCLRPTDLAARLGGDEFAILLTRGDHLMEAIAVADRLVIALRAPFVIDGRETVIGASIGIAAARSETESADELLRNADVAMYTAKQSGRRRFAVFDPLLHAELVARHELSTELTRSLGRGELLVHYQPIIELATGQTEGVEALVRWRHPNRGFVPPEEFVHLAEENGSIDALGTFVLLEACRQGASWRARMDPGVPFSINVNVSPRQLQQASFVQDVELALAESQLDPGCLVLEMTETGMLQDAEATTTKLRALQARGVRIAMDDFGTGYSSLSYLRRFPIDILKIARDFVSMDDDEDVGDADDGGWAFARAIVALGRSLRLTVIAEGIETAEQLARLVDLGCGYGQGFYFARPMPANEIEAQLIASGWIAAGRTPRAPGAPALTPV